MIIEKISVYIILYYDLGFLDDIINNIYNCVDEIIIIDGPYSYNKGVFEKLQLFYNEHNKPQELNDILTKYSSKLKYFYNEFVNEEEKRRFGYNQCKNNIILLVDTDEHIILNENNINQFIKSDRNVGGVNIYNMNRINISFDKMVQKFIIFKKKYISDLEHLDYLWLVGCKQNEKKIDYMYLNNDLGTIYHQTLNRSKFNSIIKYIFYVCLYCHTNNKPYQILSNYELNDLLCIFSIDEILDIFYHSMKEMLGIPHDKILTMTNTLINLDKYKLNHIDGFFKNNSCCIQNIPYYCYINVDNTEFKQICIEFENVDEINIELCEICVSETYKITKFNYVIKNNVTIIDYTFIMNPKFLNLLIMFNCCKTISDNFVYRIMNITLK